MTLDSASSLAASMRAGDRSAEEVVREHLERIAATHPVLNAVVELDIARALDEARRADARRAAGDPLGPLHGLPVTVKDSIDVAGFHCAAGVRGVRERRPERDAPTVARLRAAGAIIIAKTNVPELAEGFETDNLPFGRTSNPWDLSRTPGGSAGGEAALVAAGGSVIGLGSDAAGGIRVPAHYCGIAALKPTSARLPITGHFPPARGNVSARLQFGPMARCVADLALALGVLARDDWRDAESVTMPLADDETVSISELRVAWHTDNGMVTADAETATAVRCAANALADAGATVEEWRPSGLDATLEIMPGLYYGNDGGDSQRAILREMGATEVHPLLAVILERARAHRRDAGAFETLLADWKSFRHAMLRSLDSRDCILCPVARDPAPLHGASLEEDPMAPMSFSLSWSLTGWPVVVVRAGTSAGGLPIGIQLVARPWREEIALAAARVLERQLGPWPSPPLTA